MVIPFPSNHKPCVSPLKNDNISSLKSPSVTLPMANMPSIEEIEEIVEGKESKIKDIVFDVKSKLEVVILVTPLDKVP